MLPWLAGAGEHLHHLLSAQQKYCSAPASSCRHPPLRARGQKPQNQEDLSSTGPSPSASHWAQCKLGGDTGNFLRGVQTPSGVDRVNVIYDGTCQELISMLQRRRHPRFTVPTPAWLTRGSAPAVSSSHLRDLLAGHSAAGAGRGAGEKTALGSVRCPQLPPTASPSSASPTPPAPASDPPGHVEFLFQLPQAPGSRTDVLTLALPLLTPHAALGTHHCRVPSRHGAGAWHCWEGAEHTCGTARWARSTRVAPMDRLGPHVWH